MDEEFLERLWCHMLMNQSLDSSYDTIVLLPQQKGTKNWYGTLIWYTSTLETQKTVPTTEVLLSGNATWVAQSMRHLPMLPPLHDGNQNHSSPVAFFSSCVNWFVTFGVALTVGHLSPPPLPPPPVQRKNQNPKETHLLMVSVGLRTRSLLFPDWTETQETHGE